MEIFRHMDKEQVVDDSHYNRITDVPSLLQFTFPSCMHHQHHSSFSSFSSFLVVDISNIQVSFILDENSHESPLRTTKKWGNGGMMAAWPGEWKEGWVIVVTSYNEYTITTLTTFGVPTQAVNEINAILICTLWQCVLTNTTVTIWNIIMLP
jgi:hypothetical protein